MDFTDETEPQKGEPLFLGVIGSRPDVTQKDLEENILHPLLEVLGRPPDQLILPVEGLSSILISDWADSLNIPAQVYEADWHRHNRRAKLFRDLRIQNESTHFLIFLNKRSQFNEKLAERLAKKGYTVFIVPYKGYELEQLIAEEPASLGTPARPAKRGSKPSTGTERGLQQWLQSGYPESQCLLIDPSEA
jgi:hypothetical protein